MSSKSNKGYQFTFDASGTVTAIREIENGRFKFERIEANETWTYDAATHSVTKTESEKGRIETTTYTDVDGNGIFSKAGTTYGAASTTGSTGSTVFQEGYQFTIDSATNAVSAVYEVKRGVARLDSIDANETFSYDATSATVTKTEVERGLTETVIYTDANGDGIFNKVSKTYTSNNGGTTLTWNASHYGSDSHDRYNGGGGHDYYTGGLGNDQLNGNAGNDDLYGGDGLDLLYGGAGTDDLYGGNGNDTFFGGLGKDVLVGGAGNDVFKYSNVADSGLLASTRDVIADFRSGDKIDLSAIDAKAGFGGNDAFTFIGGAANLTLAKANGAVWFDNGVVYASTDRDLAAEFQIELTGVSRVTAADFVL